MHVPPAVLRVFEWRWTPCVGLAAGAVLFALVSIAAVPEQLDMSQTRSERTGSAPVLSQTSTEESSGFTASPSRRLPQRASEAIPPSPDPPPAPAPMNTFAPAPHAPPAMAPYEPSFTPLPPPPPPPPVVEPPPPPEPPPPEPEPPPPEPPPQAAPVEPEGPEQAEEVEAPGTDQQPPQPGAPE